MKKFLPYIGIVVVLVGLFSPMGNKVHAEKGTCTTKNGDTVRNIEDVERGLCVRTNQDPPTMTFEFKAYSNTNAKPAGGDTVVVTPTSTASCGWSDWTIKGCIVTAGGWISILILQIISLLLGVAGLLLNYVMKYTVLEMTLNLTKITGINVAWGVIRDLMNMGFIFLLIFEAIKVIIAQSSLADVKKFITGIVLASILINFSLFFTKIMIDASNVVTIGFYNAIIVDQSSIDNSYGLSNAFAQSLGLQGIWSGKNIESLGKQSGGDGYFLLITGLMGSVLLLVTTFVFLAITVLFIVRYVVLLVLLMLSPIAYMGIAFPKDMKKHADNWWSSLWGQLLFAPVYMIMTWVIITLMNSTGFANMDPTQWGGLVTGVGPTALPPTSSIGLLFNFIVVIGLTISSLVIAKGFATQGASQIKDLTGKAMAFTGGALMGGTARLSRATLGRAGNAMANDRNLQDKAAAGNIKARIQLAAANKAATSSFDVRATKNLGFGELSKATDINFGKADAKKENYRAMQKEEEKKAKDIAEQYKPSDVEYVKAKEADAPFKKEVEELEKSIKEKNKEIKAAKEDEKERLREELKTIEERKDIAEKKIFNEKNLNELYRKRVDTASDRLGHEKEYDNALNKIWRVVANTAGTAANVVGIPGMVMPKTKTEREALARKVRAVPKEKSKEEKAADAAKALAEEKLQKEKDDKGEEEGETKEGTTT